jgi:type 1 glutamine amidotransferase
MNRLFACSLLTMFGLCAVSPAYSQDAAKAKPKPLKALLITGGCCHDYGNQKNLLKKGIEARAHVEVTQVHSNDTSTKARFDLYDNPDWSKGYDVVLHDECSSDVIDQKYVDHILNAHKNGLPAVNLHCAMHSYRLPGKDDWFQFVGIQSAAHGPQKPIEITFIEKDHPVTKTLENWTTVNEELYNNLKLFPTAKPLARGRQDTGSKVDDYVVTWTNQYGKGRVFSTTLGHNSETVGDPRYLDMVTRGLLWSCDKLNAEYLQPLVSAEK